MTPFEMPTRGHWPPTNATPTRPAKVPDVGRRRRPRLGDELVVCSHLRWDWVWQRPQHIVSRLAKDFSRVYFVEEPRTAPDALTTSLRTEVAGPVTRVWLEVPGPERHLGFDAPEAAEYPAALAEALGTTVARTAWMYTPLAIPLARALRPASLAFDVMDDLSAFANASPLLRSSHAELLSQADVVYAGGRSLHRLVHSDREDALCIPSGVELEHFAVARQLRPQIERSQPVAGYIGVIDERLDLELLASVAAALPDWEVRVVGPVAKIDPKDLPQLENVTFPGPASYSELPRTMAGFDVAIMPFAHNAATKSISPTKTMEFLAAGLPVVSTSVPDVVHDFGRIVWLADDAASFAAACRSARAVPTSADRSDVRRILRWNHWDAIAERMFQRLVAVTAPVDGQRAATQTDGEMCS